MESQGPPWKSEFIRFVRWLADNLPDSQLPLPEHLGLRILKCIDQTAELRLTAEENDRMIWLAVKLWNSSLPESASVPKSEQLLCEVRALACLLLNLGAGRRRAHGQSEFRSQLRFGSEVSCKTAHLCLSNGHIALAERLVESLVCNYSAVADAFEYLCIRIHLAWLHNRLDTSKLWLSKLKESGAPPSRSEYGWADLGLLLYRIGQDCAKAQKHKEAVFWLEEADAAVESAPSSGSDEGWRPGCLFELIRARLLLREKILSAGGEPALKEVEKLDKLVTRLESAKLGDSSYLSLYRLVLLATNCPEARVLHASLQRFLIEHPVDVDSFDPYLWCVGKLRNLDSQAAVTLLENTASVLKLRAGTAGPLGNHLRGKLLPILLMAMEALNPQLVPPQRVLALLAEHDGPDSPLPFTLDRAPAQACHALIWKAIGKPGTEAKLGALWCQAALHNCFLAAGTDNMTKFFRRLLAKLAEMLEEQGSTSFNGPSDDVKALVEVVCDNKTPCPGLEIETIATALFNLALISYRSWNDAVFESWHRLAMKLAQRVPDNPRFLPLLEARTAMLHS